MHLVSSMQQRLMQDLPNLELVCYDMIQAMQAFAVRAMAVMPLKDGDRNPAMFGKKKCMSR